MSHFVLSIFILTAFVAYCSFLILEPLASIHQNYITKEYRKGWDEIPMSLS